MAIHEFHDLGVGRFENRIPSEAIIHPPLRYPWVFDPPSWVSRAAEARSSLVRTVLPDQSSSVVYHYGRIRKRCYDDVERQGHIFGGNDVVSCPWGHGCGCDCGWRFWCIDACGGRHGLCCDSNGGGHGTCGPLQNQRGILSYQLVKNKAKISSVWRPFPPTLAATGTWTGMNCGKMRICVSVGLFWEYVSAMNHCGKWI